MYVVYIYVVKSINICYFDIKHKDCLFCFMIVKIMFAERTQTGNIESGAQRTNNGRIQRI